jgi:disulfide bond formation protein DsbB
LSARSILIALAFSAWLVASVIAFLIVAYTGFFGMAFIGLIICYVSAQFELDGDRPVGSSLATSFLGAQLRAQRDLPAEQRRSIRHEQSLSIQSARFFKFFGLGLMVIGLGGGLYYQL